MRIIALCTIVAILMTPAAITADTQQSDQTMRAVRINEFGPPEVLRVERVQRPTPGQGELLVRVHAAAVNPIDTIVRTDGAPGVSNARLPYTPGFDLSGEVVQLGEDATDFKVGDEVFAKLHLRRGGAYAEQLTQIAKLVEDDKLKPIVSHLYQLRDAVAAHKQSETRRTRGKIVLRIIE